MQSLKNANRARNADLPKSSDEAEARMWQRHYHDERERDRLDALIIGEQRREQRHVDAMVAEYKRDRAHFQAHLALRREMKARDKMVADWIDHMIATLLAFKLEHAERSKPRPRRDRGRRVITQ